MGHFCARQKAANFCHPAQIHYSSPLFFLTLSHIQGSLISVYFTKIPLPRWHPRNQQQQQHQDHHWQHGHQDHHQQQILIISLLPAAWLLPPPAHPASFPIYLCTCVCVCEYLCMCASVRVHLGVCVCVYISVRVQPRKLPMQILPGYFRNADFFICLYICVYICFFICFPIYICTCPTTQTSNTDFFLPGCFHNADF